MTDKPLIDFGDDELWHDELHTNQLELFQPPSPTQPTTIPPPYAPKERRIEDVETKEDLL